MKRLFILLLFPCFLFNFANEGGAGDKVAASEPAAASATVEGAQSQAAAEKQEGAPQAVKSETKEASNAISKKEEKPIVGARPSNQPPQSGQVLTLQAQDMTAKSGSKACMDVKVMDFDNLLSMQYTMAWDAKLLTFTDIRNFGLPGLNGQNFGTNRTAQGLLTTVWIDGSLRGVTLPDNSTIFSVCFDVKGPAGQSAFFRFTDKPTAFESVDVNEELVEIKTLEGKVVIQ